MRNKIVEISHEYSRAIILKLRAIIVIGALISLSACTGYTLNSSEVGSVIPIYPVVQF